MISKSHRPSGLTAWEKLANKAKICAIARQPPEHRFRLRLFVRHVAMSTLHMKKRKKSMALDGRAFFPLFLYQPHLCEDLLECCLGELAWRPIIDKAEVQLPHSLR